MFLNFSILRWEFSEIKINAWAFISLLILGDICILNFFSLCNTALWGCCKCSWLYMLFFWINKFLRWWNCTETAHSSMSLLYLEFHPLYLLGIGCSLKSFAKHVFNFYNYSWQKDWSETNQYSLDECKNAYISCSFQSVLIINLTYTYLNMITQFCPVERINNQGGVTGLNFNLG